MTLTKLDLRTQSNRNKNINIKMIEICGLVRIVYEMLNLEFHSVHETGLKLSGVKLLGGLLSEP